MTPSDLPEIGTGTDRGLVATRGMQEFAPILGCNHTFWLLDIKYKLNIIILSSTSELSLKGVRPVIGRRM